MVGRGLEEVSSTPGGLLEAACDGSSNSCAARLTQPEPP
jgi:hypothetical protein